MSIPLALLALLPLPQLPLLELITPSQPLALVQPPLVLLLLSLVLQLKITTSLLLLALPLPPLLPLPLPLLLMQLLALKTPSQPSSLVQPPLARLFSSLEEQVQIPVPLLLLALPLPPSLLLLQLLALKTPSQPLDLVQPPLPLLLSFLEEQQLQMSQPLLPQLLPQKELFPPLWSMCLLLKTQPLHLYLEPLLALKPRSQLLVLLPPFPLHPSVLHPLLSLSPPPPLRPPPLLVLN
jgi:hypothetical protein